jgi:Ca2+-binding EF-hand superfamily protein
MTRPPLAVAALLALAGTVPADPPGTVLDAVHFAPGGPVRVRLRVTVAGRPADAVWAEAADRLFAFADRNGDGTLDAKERAAFAPPGRGRADDEVVLPDGLTAGRPLRLTFPKGDDPVDRAAFRAAVRAAGFGPVTAAAAAGRADADRLSDALARRLDADGDGALSPAELAAARDRLAAFDVNEDEYVTAAELLGQPPADPRRVVPVPRGRAEPDPDAPAEFLFLAPGPVGAAVKQVLTARGGERAALTRQQLGADERWFARLDRDANGKLDTDELAAWLRQPPDADVALDLPAGDAAAAPAAVPPAALAADAGGLVFARPGLRVRFEPAAGAAAAARGWQATAARVTAVFEGVAKDGAVERKQLDGVGAGFGGLFDLADRNADGKVDRAELTAALAAVGGLTGCRAEVSFADDGRGLFEPLDRDGDGRLSPRELIDAPAVLRPFAGADGKVRRDALPRRVTVRATPAGLGMVPSASADRRPGVDVPAWFSEVPAWFRHADRNGDGEVSLREFLGPLELFRRLDANGDGLISPEEAKR